MTRLQDDAIEITYVGGATALLHVGGLTILTDPSFEGTGRDLGPIDIVLLSHGRHAGSAAHDPARVLTSVAGAARLGPAATPLERWSAIDVTRPDGKVLHVTGIPVQPWPPAAGAVAAEGTGFVLSGDGVPTVYVSGDNASLAVVSEIRERCGPVDIALLFAGTAQEELQPGRHLALSAEGTAEATLLLGRPKTLALHVEEWKHFSEGPAVLEAAYDAAGLPGLLTIPKPGTTVTLSITAAS